jgi:hypothetical protein
VRKKAIASASDKDKISGTRTIHQIGKLSI